MIYINSGKGYNLVNFGGIKVESVVEFLIIER